MKATGAVRQLDTASYTTNDAVLHTGNLLSENDTLSSGRVRIEHPVSRDSSLFTERVRRGHPVSGDCD